jgi:hypothetical protein
MRLFLFLFVFVFCVKLTLARSVESFLASSSRAPTRKPSPKPSRRPSAGPTSRPTAHPTVHPTAHPTARPTAHPTSHPTAYPVATKQDVLRTGNELDENSVSSSPVLSAAVLIAVAAGCSGALIILGCFIGAYFYRKNNSSDFSLSASVLPVTHLDQEKATELLANQTDDDNHNVPLLVKR